MPQRTCRSSARSSILDRIKAVAGMKISEQADRQRYPRPGPRQHAAGDGERRPGEAEEQGLGVELRHQCPACGPRSRPDRASCSSIWATRRSRPAWSFASARATSTSWVFEARSSHQPSAVLTRAPSVRSTSAPVGGEPVEHLVDHRELAALVDLEAQLRRVDHRRHRRAQRGQRAAELGHRADQPDRGVERVVEAVIIVREEDVAAHLAGERRAGLLHLRLDQAVAGLPHQRLAAQLGDPVEQRLARLDVGDDRRAGHRRAAPARRGSRAAGRPRPPGPRRRPRRSGRRRRRRRCRNRGPSRATSAFRSARFASSVGSG